MEYPKREINIDVSLTQREMEVAEVVVFSSKKEAANILGVSYKTVDNTIQRIFSKVGISKVTELTIFIFCRKFNIPLSMCVPARRFTAACLLTLFCFGEFMHFDQPYSRRIRRSRTEQVIRSRKLNT